MMHGPHQTAQKSTSTTCPLRSATLASSPFQAWSATSSGAGLPIRNAWVSSGSFSGCAVFCGVEPAFFLGCLFACWGLTRQPHGQQGEGDHPRPDAAGYPHDLFPTRVCNFSTILTRRVHHLSLVPKLCLETPVGKTLFRFPTLLSPRGTKRIFACQGVPKREFGNKGGEGVPKWEFGNGVINKRAGLIASPYCQPRSPG